MAFGMRFRGLAITKLNELSMNTFYFITVFSCPPTPFHAKLATCVLKA
jgi:hypothetical protein